MQHKQPHTTIILDEGRVGPLGPQSDLLFKAMDGLVEVDRDAEGVEGRNWGCLTLDRKEGTDSDLVVAITTARPWWGWRGRRGSSIHDDGGRMVG